MKRLCVIYIFAALFFLNPLQLHETGLMHYRVHDDASYFSHASALAFFKFPSYENELTNSPAHSMGAGLMAAPFVFLFSGIDRWQEHAVVQKRTTENIGNSWSLFGFVVATQVYFLLGIFCLYRSLGLFFDEKVVLVGLVFLFFCEYFPLYLFRRPVLSHIYEFFLQSVFVSLLLCHLKTGVVHRVKVYTIILFGLIAGMMILVRYNNILFAFMWPVVLLQVHNQNRLDLLQSAKRVVPVWAVALSFFTFFKLLPTDQTNSDVYIASTVSLLAHSQSLWFYVQRLFYVIGGLDWGLLFTGPFLLMGVGTLLFLKDNVSKLMRVVSLPILLNLYIVLAWATQGGWYGYRYMVFSLCPLIVFSFCAFLKKVQQHWTWCTVIAVCSLIALVPLISMLSFEGNASTLNLSFIVQPFGKLGWGNAFYHEEIVQLALSVPNAFLLIFLQGGFSYWFLVVSCAMGFETSVFFNFEILAKSLILYGLPFVILGFYRFLRQRLKDVMV